MKFRAYGERSAPRGACLSLKLLVRRTQTWPVADALAAFDSVVAGLRVELAAHIENLIQEAFDRSFQ
jgi:hypothetical protein